MKPRAQSLPTIISSSPASGAVQILRLDGPQCTLFVSNLVVHWYLGTRRGFVALLPKSAGSRVCCGGLCSLLKAARKTHFHGVPSEMGRTGGDMVENVTSLRFPKKPILVNRWAWMPEERFPCWQQGFSWLELKLEKKAKATDRHIDNKSMVYRVPMTA